MTACSTATAVASPCFYPALLAGAFTSTRPCTAKQHKRRPCQHQHQLLKLRHVLSYTGAAPAQTQCRVQRKTHDPCGDSPAAIMACPGTMTPKPRYCYTNVTCHNTHVNPSTVRPSYPATHPASVGHMTYDLTLWHDQCSQSAFSLASQRYVPRSQRWDPAASNCRLKDCLNHATADDAFERQYPRPRCPKSAQHSASLAELCDCCVLTLHPARCILILVQH